MCEMENDIKKMVVDLIDDDTEAAGKVLNKIVTDKIAAMKSDAYQKSLEDEDS